MGVYDVNAGFIPFSVTLDLKYELVFKEILKITNTEFESFVKKWNELSKKNEDKSYIDQFKFTFLSPNLIFYDTIPAFQTNLEIEPTPSA